MVIINFVLWTVEILQTYLNFVVHSTCRKGNLKRNSCFHLVYCPGYFCDVCRFCIFLLHLLCVLCLVYVISSYCPEYWCISAGYILNVLKMRKLIPAETCVFTALYMFFDVLPVCAIYCLNCINIIPFYQTIYLPSIMIDLMMKYNQK